jgi:hypothetical protein
VLLFSGNAAEALRHPAAPRCLVFPKSNPWNQRVDRLPVAADSDAIISHAMPPSALGSRDWKSCTQTQLVDELVGGSLGSDDLPL